jgi:DNA-3-methyladenine glycosylase II
MIPRYNGWTRRRVRFVSMKEAIEHLRGNDPILGAIIERVGEYAMVYRPPEFESLVRSIVYQQLSGRVASVIFGRLAAATGNALTPERILKLRPSRMRTLGLSSAKTAYIRDLARHTRDGKLVFEALPALADDDVIEHLTQVKGIGTWTAHMFLMFALRRPDILPVGDLGIRSAMRKAYGLNALPAPAEMQAIAQSWRPWSSVASWYLWRSLDGPAEL